MHVQYLCGGQGFALPARPFPRSVPLATVTERAGGRDVASEDRSYFTDERRMMQELARNFARDEVTPVANRLDPEKGDMPRELIHKMGDLGFFGILIPED